MPIHRLVKPFFSILTEILARAAPRRRLSPVQALALSFVLVIVIGAGLLALPIAQQPGVKLSLLDYLFTATSATCVTGLVTVSTADTWTHFGQVAILLMIQIGGLGYMTFATMFALLLGARVGLRRRLHMKEAHGVLTLQNAAQVVRFVGLGTLLIEGIGAVSLTLRFHFHHAMVWKEAMLEGVFYSVSAFCNAGFDLVPGFQGLAFTPYRQDLWLLLLIGLLIVLGGLGFGVLGELGAFTRTRRFSLHAKLVLTISGALVLIGMVCFYLLEATNPLTLGAIKSPVEQGVFSWFMSVTPRTAGFSPLDISVLSPPTLLIIELLMVIGASPYSTGGGIKTTTMAVIILAIIAQVRRRQDIEVYGRRISGDMVRLALSLVSVYVLATLLVLFSITIIEITLPGLSSNGEAMTLFERLTFEVISAFGTVGLTHSLTPTLQPVSQVLIMLAMYLGRLGPLAFIFVFAQPTEGPMLRRLPSESVMAG